MSYSQLITKIAQQTAAVIPSFDELWEEVKAADPQMINNIAGYYMDGGYDDEFQDDTGIELDGQNTYAEFLNWAVEVKIRQEVEDKYESIVNNYKNLQGGTCWRAVTMPRHMDPRKHPRLGIYWSVSLSGARPYNGQYTGKKIVVYSGEINTNYIDWKGTLLARLDFNLGDDEMEIRFMKNSPIYIYDCEVFEINWTNPQKFEIDEVRHA